MSTSLKLLASLAFLSLSLFSCGGSSSDATDPRVAFAGAGGANGSWGSWGNVGPGTGVPTEFTPGGNGTPTPPAPPEILYDEFLQILNVPDGGGGNIMALGINDDGSLEHIENYTEGVSRPTSIVRHPSQEYIYTLDLARSTTDFENRVLRAYAVNRRTGRLTPVGRTFPNQTNPQNLAVSPDGQFVFVSNPALDPYPSTLTVYRVGDDGGLTPSGTPLEIASRYEGLNVSPDGNYLFGLGYIPALPSVPGRYAIDTYAIDPTSGALTAQASIETEGSRPFSLAFGFEGTFAFVPYGDNSFVSTYSYDASNGTFSLVGRTPTQRLSYGVVAHPTLPVFYVTAYESWLETFSYDSAGRVTELGEKFDFFGLGGYLAFDSTATHAYFTDYWRDEINRFSVGADGVLTEVDVYDGEDFPGLDPRELINIVSTNLKMVEESELAR